MLPPFVLVTGNAGKVAEARLAAGCEIEAVEVDLPEIQSLDLVEVLREKGAEAWRRLRRPLVVEESGLELAALHGFPGPLVKWMLAAVGAEGVARTAHALGEPAATARCALLYKDGGREVLAVGSSTGTLVLPGRGTNGFGWDPIFLPSGESRTFAEMTAAEKLAQSHRGRAWRELVRQLSAAEWHTLSA